MIGQGTLLGPYEVLAQIGAGGMGEVYRGRDPRLGREVAIKILPSQFSENADRVRRFEQEARAAGILNHPNILTIYDIGEHDGSLYVVSELLVGETLRERMGGSAIPARKTIEYALQIAHGLAAAHEKGIVHRDLKPENLFVTRDGRVKILDFGLAKLTAPEPVEGPHSKLQTKSGATEPGMVMGTMGYMSPEQVRGQEVDHRSDIFTFGAILYEMLSGKRAFLRGSGADTMSAILKEDPPELDATNRNYPPALEHLIRHCLEKNAEQRFQSARDLAFDLEMLSGVSGSEFSQTAVPVAAVTRKSRKNLLLAIALLAAVALGVFVGRLITPATKQSVVKTESPSFQALTFRRGYLSMSRFAPDTQSIIYSASWNGAEPELFSTRPQSPVSRPLGLPAADLLSISRNGEMAILLNPTFVSGWRRSGTLARVPIDGGAPREIMNDVQDADWGPDGKSLAVVRDPGRLEYPAGTLLLEQRGWISDIRVSPKGDAVAFMEHPGMGDDRGVVSVINLQKEKKTLTDEWASESGLAWSPDGNEIWFTASKGGSNQQILYAVTLSGELRVVSGMAGNLVLNDIASDGRVLLLQDNRRREMVLMAPGAEREVDFSWFDWSFPRDISNDGKWVLFEEQGAGGGSNYSVYLRNTDGSPAVRLGDGYAIALSPDGTMALSSLPGGTVKPVILPTGVGEPKSLKIPDQMRVFSVATWFRDSKRILLGGSDGDHPPRDWIYDLGSSRMSPVTPEGILSFILSPDQKSILAGSENGFALYPVEGGEAQEVKGLEASEVILGYTSDGHSVYVRPDRKIPIKLYRVDLVSGQRSLWKVIDPTDPAGILDISSIRITPDGHSYVYTYRRVLSNLYLAQSLL